MSFFVNTSAHPHIPNAVICLAENLKISKKKTDMKVYSLLEKDLLARLESIQSQRGNTLQVTGFSSLYKAEQAGIKLFRNVSERKSFPKYNNVVLAYLLASVEYLTPIGAHDATDITKDSTFVIKKASGNEKITPSFETEEVAIFEGEFTYGTESKEKGFDPYAWLGSRDVDSALHQIKEDSSKAIFTVIGHQDTSLEHNLEIAKKIAENILLSSPEANISFHICQKRD